MKKRILSFLLSLLMIVSLVPIGVFAEGETLTIYAEDVEVDYGARTVSVNIMISNNPGVAGLKFGVSYDTTALTLVNATDENSDVRLSAILNPDYTKYPYVVVFERASNDKSEGILFTMEFEINPDAQPGSYNVDVAVAKPGDITDEKYNNVPCTTKSGSVTLTAEEINSSVALPGKTVTYNGNVQNLFLTNTSKLPEGYSVTYTCDGEAFEGTKNVGTYNIQALVKAPGCYDKTFESVLTINPKKLTYTAGTVSTRAYDGTTDVKYSKEGTVSGIVYGDDVVCEVTSQMASANAGTGIKVNVSFNLVGTDKDNYIVPNTPSLTGTISKRAVTVTANGSKREGTEDPVLVPEVVSGSIVEGDEFTGEVARVAGEAPKTYAVTKGTLSLGSNYNLTFKQGTFTILAREEQNNVKVEGIPETITYGDEGFEVKVTTTDNTDLVGEVTLVSSDENVLSTNGFDVTVKNAGTATLTVTVKGDDYYKDYIKHYTVTVGKRVIKVEPEYTTKYVGQTEDPVIGYKIVEGSLVDGDAFTGALTRTQGNTVKKYDVKLGTLSAGDNYVLTLVNGTGKFEILKKLTQKLELVCGTAFVYGDENVSFAINPVDGEAYNKDATAYAVSSDENVATIGENFAIEIKNVGKTTITVTMADNYMYDEWKKSVTINVSKRPITIIAENASKKEGNADPELKYVLDGTIVDGDELTVTLERASGEKVGKYDINVVSYTITNPGNYNVEWNKGVFEILDKELQTITVAEVGAKTYGCDDFKLEVTPDEASKLDTFTYVSSNTDVADVAADGTVTIKGVGETTITVSEAGNEDYAPAEGTVKIVVNPIAVTVTAIDVDNKTATIDGVLDADKAGVELDFDSIKTTVVSSEKTTVEETTTITSTLKATNFTLKGEKAKNYTTDKSSSVTTTVVSTTVEEKLTEDENVTIEAAPIDDKTIIVTDVAVVPESEVKKVTIDVTAIADTKVNTVALPKTTVDTIIGIDAEASLEITLKDGSDENKESTITLNAQALAEIQTAGSSATTLSISVEKVDKEDLETEQATKVDEVSAKSPVVYSLSIVDENGVSVATSFGDLGKATVILPYVKPNGNGNVIVKFLDDFGNLTNVANPKYDAETQAVTIELGHFSEYLIYTEPKPAGGGGGGGSTKPVYTVDFYNGETKHTFKIVEKGNTVAIPDEDPVKEGFTFEGWFTDKEFTTPYDFAKEVTSSFELYAKFVEIKQEGDDNENNDKPEDGEETKWTNPFGDVAEGDWYYEYVGYAVTNGLFNGMSETEFGPNVTLTRAMLVTVLYRAEKEPETVAGSDFSDVSEDAYYSQAVAWAKQNGIVNGVTNTEFAPNGTITREQFATIMHRYAMFKEYDVSMGEETNILSYDDFSDISEYAIAAIQYTAGSGLMNGRSESTINPKDSATRAEAATILARFFEMYKD